MRDAVAIVYDLIDQVEVSPTKRQRALDPEYSEKHLQLGMPVMASVVGHDGNCRQGIVGERLFEEKEPPIPHLILAYITKRVYFRV